MRTMRPEVKRWFKIIFCSLLVVFSVSIGFSDWVVPGDGKDVTKGSEKATTTDVVPCAFIDNDETTLYTIEDALDKAGSLSGSNVVYVKPGTNPTIERNCTVASGDVLCLSNGQERVTDEESIGKATLSGEQNFSYGDSSKLKNKVSIADGVTLTNNGSLEINGVLSGGGGGQYGSGWTAGDYCQITLGTGSKIQNYGKIYCFGFIDGKGGVYSHSGSSIDLPFVINDYKGGTRTSLIAALYSNKKVSYFEMFEINNVFSHLYVYYGALIRCHTNVYSKKVFHSTFDLVGNNALFRLGDANSYLDFFVDNNNDRVEYYTVYGSMTMGTISVSLESLSVSSDSFDLPFSYRQHIVCKSYSNGNSASVTLPHYYKLLPGAYFKVDKGVSLKCSNRLFVYNENQFFQDDVGGKPYTASYSKLAGTFIVNGNFESKEFGGIIRTECSGATVKVTSSVSPTIREHTGKNTFSSVKISDINGLFQFYPYSNGQVSSILSNGSKNVTYTSAGNDNSGYGFGK